MVLLIEIVEQKDSENSCFVSKDIADTLLLDPDRVYKFRFGQCFAETKLTILDDGSQSLLKLDSAIFTKLAISESLNTCITVLDNSIVLGPVLGIFVNPQYLKALKLQSPRPSSLHMMKANENFLSFIYFFSIRGALRTDNKIAGWYYSRGLNSWVKALLPVPDVVYDRGVGFHEKVKPLVDQVRKRFSPEGSIMRINSRDCLDKYWLCERLKRYEDIQQYMPKTVRFNCINDLITLVREYKTVYLKSFYGSQGSEVMTVTLQPDNSFKCSFFDSNKLKFSSVRDIDSLSNLVHGFFKEKEFIVQQGIDLLEYNNSRIDMRILIQKDGKGLWTSVYNVVILGIRNSLITADEEKGGRFYNFADIMPLVLNAPHSKVDDLDRQLKQVCITVAEAIEKEYGMFGEIGMDVALDKNLKIWFIEANSKPDRNLEAGIKGSARVRATCLNLLDYAKYLAGFH